MTGNDAVRAAPRLLLVEDDVQLARAVTRHLCFHGFDVMVAHTGAAARTGSDCYDFAILDIELPDANGVDLAQSLIEQRRVDCVVFYSSTRDEAVLRRAATLGPVLDKTVGIAEVIEVLQASKPTSQGGTDSTMAPAARKPEHSGTLPTLRGKRPQVARR